MFALLALALVAAAPPRKFLPPKPFDLIVADRETLGLPRGEGIYVWGDFLAVVVNVGPEPIKGDELLFSDFEVTSSDTDVSLFPFHDCMDSLTDDLGPGDAIGSDSLVFTRQLHPGERLEPGRATRSPCLSYLLERDESARSDGPVNFHVVWDLAGSRAEWDFVATLSPNSGLHAATHTRRIHAVPLRMRVLER